VKSPKGRISPYQQQFIDTISQAGGLAFVTRGVDDIELHLQKNP
jgi:hypothetical protein